MPDASIGSIVATILAMFGEAALKGAAGEVAKDLYKSLKSKVAHWAKGDLEALEASPNSAGRQAVVAELVDSLPVDERTAIATLVQKLIPHLRPHAIGLDISRLEAMSVRLGEINVSGGIGARIEEARIQGAFTTGPITVEPKTGK
jgi:hypothetical protein